MNFIKKVFDKNIDEEVHSQFQKFSRGKFKDRALINARQINGKCIISTTPEFANELVRFCAEKLGNKKTRIKGAIISTRNLKEEQIFHDLLAHAEVKQFQGVKRFLIDTEMSGQEIIVFLNACPKGFFALSFDAEGIKLKIKPKAPKSGKPSSKKSEKPKPNFCRIVAKDSDIGKNFIFEKPDFKKAEITHSFIIDDIIISDGLRKKRDFAKIREMAKRKGKIIRYAIIDGKEIKSECRFEA